MSPKLLKSQFDALETPHPDEAIRSLTVEEPPERVLELLDRLVDEFESAITGRP